MTSPVAARRWPSLLTVAQAARMLDYDPQTVRALLKRGVLRGRRMGGGKGTYVLRRDQALVDARRHQRAVREGYRTRREGHA
ncbi:helix-turn-helix domain-containing protein [Cellulosimicrobium funkei]|uniref:helix-turn-helix domain-containing protein n=1 Tax=Cellulosimicrobium funkei TaxID=264251 RepID=UPI00370190B7